MGVHRTWKWGARVGSLALAAGRHGQGWTAWCLRAKAGPGGCQAFLLSWSLVTFLYLALGLCGWVHGFRGSHTFWGCPVGSPRGYCPWVAVTQAVARARGAGVSGDLLGASWVPVNPKGRDSPLPACVHQLTLPASRWGVRAAPSHVRAFSVSPPCSVLGSGPFHHFGGCCLHILRWKCLTPVPPTPLWLPAPSRCPPQMGPTCAAVRREPRMPWPPPRTGTRRRGR